MQSVPPGSKWKAGTTHRARVVGFSQFDNLVQLSLQPSVINAAFFNVSDLEIGASVKVCDDVQQLVSGLGTELLVRSTFVSSGYCQEPDG